MTDQRKAYLYAGIAIFFWSTVASAFKVGLQHINFIQFLFFASWTSLFILLIINLFRGNLKQLRSLEKKDIAFSALMGALSPFAYYLVLFKAYEILPAQVAQPLNMVWPIVLVFLSVILLKQKISYKSFIALFISFIGVYFISSQGEPGVLAFKEPLGVILAAGSSLIWSLYWIYNVKKGMNETLQLLLNFFFASVYITLFILIFNDFRNLDMTGITLAVYAGIFEMGITFILWIKAMKLTASNDKISNLVYIAPFLSLVFIHYFVGETIYVTSLIGLSLIVVGILIEKLRLI
ncbi:MAG: DMT family transporter [Bacteroidales bacterium]|nr:DMT family transporter [Bacteroidales bacterium]